MTEHVSDSSSNTRKRLRGAISLLLVVGIFAYAIPAIADYGDVWDSLTEMSRFEIVAIIAIAAFNLWTYLPFLTSVMPGLKQRQAFVVNNSTTAVSNTVPAGAAFGVGLTYSMYRSWGFSKTAISVSVIVSAIWNTFTKLGLPIIALALLAVVGEASTALVTASLIGLGILAVAIAIFASILRSAKLAASLGNRAEGLAGRVLRKIKRPAPSGWGDRAVDFRESVIDLVRDRWMRITFFTLLSHLTLFAVLLIAVRSVGVDNGTVGWETVLASFAFGRLVTAIPITPGGLGVIELGYVAALSVGATDAVSAQIVAAVLLFRSITFLPPILIGGFTYLFWRKNTSWRKDPSDSSSA